MQILLCLVLVLCVAISERKPFMAAVAGAIVGLTLSIGLESIAYALLCAAWYPGMWILKGRPRAAAMGHFALGLLAATLLLTFGLFVPSSGFSAYCDVFSFAYAPALIVGAGGLYGLARTQHSMGHWPTRLAAAAALGTLCILSIAAIAPECLKGPYAALTPELREVWFSRVAETQGVWSMFENDPTSALALYPYLAFALGCGVWGIWYLLRQKMSQAEGLIFLTAMLVIGFLQGLAQVRAINIAAFFAIPVFAVFAGIVRKMINTDGQNARTLSALIFAWVVGTNALWLVFTGQAEGGAANDARLTGGSAGCGLPHELAVLEKHPPGIIINGIDLGPWLTAYTKHGAVSGHYHRNERGILDAHRALTAEPDKARALIKARGGTFVVWCAAGAGGEVLKDANEAGLVAQVERGNVPQWLVPLTDPATSGLRVLKVVEQPVPN